MPPIKLTVSIAIAAVLAGCGERDAAPANEISNTELPATVAPVSAELMGPDGASRGSVQVSQDATGVMVRIAATGLSAGPHGVHLHTTGTCVGPKFESAGGHWNPTGKQHGRDNPQGAHSGDLANLNIAADGRGTSQLLVPGATLSPGTALSLADGDGTALVIHAKADDYKTDPSGASGDRIACAVVAAPTL